MKRIILTISTLLCTLALAAQTKIVEYPETDAVYRLPLAKGVSAVATPLTPLQLGLARSMNTVDFCAWELTTNRESDVVAPRGGVVESVTENRVLILHEDGIYTLLRAIDKVCVAEGDTVEKGDKVGVTSLGSFNNKWRVWMEVFHLRSNPNKGEIALSGSFDHLRQYINPIFTTRQKCKVQLTEGQSYTVRTRTWCWPWE